MLRSSEGGETDDRNNLIKGLTITDEAAAPPPAADNGVMKVKITGLTPNTVYYFRTSDSFYMKTGRLRPKFWCF